MSLFRFTTIAMLLLAAAPASALRGVEAGAPCAGLSEIEAALGSKLRGSSDEQKTGEANVYFDGFFHGKVASISYTCEAGAVERQIIDVRFADEHEALVYFSDRHRELSEQFGPPHKDPDEPRIAEIADATGVPVRRFATWVLGERVVSLMLSPEDEKQWQVLISGP